jgi:hypothetical protein
MLDLTPFVSAIREQLLVAAQAGGDEARELAERLTAPLDSAVRLTLLEALEQAAAEITRELAPGAVELRLRAGSPEFVVTAPADSDGPGDRGYGDLASAAMDAAMSWVTASGASGEREMARVNLRLPEGLKAKVDEAADRAGLSTNAWLVRVAATAVESEPPGTPGGEPGRRSRTYKGWVR